MTCKWNNPEIKIIFASPSILYGVSYDEIIIYRINHIQPGTTPTDSIALEYDEPIPEEYTVDTKVHWERINKTVLPLLTDIGALEKTKQASLGDFL